MTRLISYLFLIINFIKKKFETVLPITVFGIFFNKSVAYDDQITRVNRMYSVFVSVKNVLNVVDSAEFT